jgi:hypothetical protein
MAPYCMSMLKLGSTSVTLACACMDISADPPVVYLKLSIIQCDIYIFIATIMLCIQRNHSVTNLFSLFGPMALLNNSPQNMVHNSSTPPILTMPETFVTAGPPPPPFIFSMVSLLLGNARSSQKQLSIPLAPKSFPLPLESKAPSLNVNFSPALVVPLVTLQIH